MKTLLLNTPAIALMFIFSSLFAPSSHAQVLDQVQRSLSGNATTYRVEKNAQMLKLINPKSGDEICTVQLTAANEILLKGSIGPLKISSPEAMQRATRTAIDFNLSSPVGTMWPDTQAAAVTMVHRMSSNQLSIDQITRTVLLFGKSIEAERMAYSNMIAGDIRVQVR